jgi:hypothetical protein
MSLIVISLTPATGGSLPADTVTFEDDDYFDPEVNAEKFYF